MKQLTSLEGIHYLQWSLRESNGSWETWMKELKHYKGMNYLSTKYFATKISYDGNNQSTLTMHFLLAMPS